MIKSKSRQYRAENKDLIQTKKNQHYVQNGDKICKKQSNYYDKNVDLLLEKKKMKLLINKSKVPVKIELNYLRN